MLTKKNPKKMHANLIKYQVENCLALLRRNLIFTWIVGWNLSRLDGLKFHPSIPGSCNHQLIRKFSGKTRRLIELNCWFGLWHLIVRLRHVSIYSFQFEIKNLIYFLLSFIFSILLIFAYLLHSQIPIKE